MVALGSETKKELIRKRKIGIYIFLRQYRTEKKDVKMRENKVK